MSFATPTFFRGPWETAPSAPRIRITGCAWCHEHAHDYCVVRRWSEVVQANKTARSSAEWLLHDLEQHRRHGTPIPPDGMQELRQTVKQLPGWNNDDTWDWIFK